MKRRRKKENKSNKEFFLINKETRKRKRRGEKDENETCCMYIKDGLGLFSGWSDIHFRYNFTFAFGLLNVIGWNVHA